MNTIFVTTILPIISECLIMIYYTNSIMKYRHSRIRSNIIIVFGYAVYCLVCMTQSTAVNVIGFIVVNGIVLYAGFIETLSDMLIKIGILTVLMMFGELVAALIVNVKIEPELYHTITTADDIIFYLTSKVVYCVLVIILRRISISRSQKYKAKEAYWLLLLPLSTCIFLSIFNKIHTLLSGENQWVAVLLCLLLILTNFVVYIVCDRIMEKNRKIRHLQALESKRETDLKSYRVIKEKYDDLRIMVHDFEKYCRNIEGMLNADQNDVRSVIHDLENKNKEFLLTEYTNNKALNILLSQKAEECIGEDIVFQIYAQDIDLSFLAELDVVSIFANLMDNAIESCRRSAEKRIFLSVYGMNDAYIVIKVENSCGRPPQNNNGLLISSKDDSDVHGIGMESINHALERYDGRLKWSYDHSARVFNTLIIINYFALSCRESTEHDLK